MFLAALVRRHPEFRIGMRAMAPQAPGVAAWGLMTGVAMAKSGLSLAESTLMALLVYAGSSQLASLPLIVAGAPAWVILATGFCVNLRFVVFSLHLRPYLVHLPLWQRLAHGYVTADMAYAIFTQRFPQPAADDEGRRAQESFLAGSCAVNWSSWVAASLLGIALANFIPTHWGLGFAGILCLVGILCSLATTRLRVVSAIVASVAAVAAYALPLKLNIVLAIAIAVLLCMTMERLPSRRERAEVLE
ncbi:branched-chain amino acid ABC transporter permease [Ramlibacter henchirensis]|uniref:Branched-chain amino acid ABC transporter permease n=1 Tax=Ramlibacter henchirensis TaxID=204072 RepID=A0A4Z0C8E9_9BURK|nr:AzlC family ABC transporter permease [Ramlibacter henchirensis]TFZ07551.1 branched-chain amino acid ABC transporter permease [Ramlibacter henchirensis]